MYLCIFVSVARYVCVEQSVSHLSYARTFALHLTCLPVYAQYIEISDMNSVLLACCSNILDQLLHMT
jgi:hypothetical protein